MIVENGNKTMRPTSVVLVGNYELCETVNGAVLVSKDQQDGRIISLNETGKLIWTYIENDISIECIIELICKDYSVEYDMVKRDVCSFIDSMKALGICR